MQRAYSVLDVKSLDSERRVFRGIATTPALDRVSDRVDPMKATFAREIPLLHAHDHRAPIGVVRLGKPTKAGIPFEAEIPIIHEPPTLKERVDVAWGEIVHGLVRAVSIGFRTIESPKYNDMGGVDFGAIEIMETSTVSIPAQSEALIHTIKSIDAAARLAAGVEDQEEFSIDPSLQADAGQEQDGSARRRGHVVRLQTPGPRAAPFVINRIHHLR